MLGGTTAFPKNLTDYAVFIAKVPASWSFEWGRNRVCFGDKTVRAEPGRQVDVKQVRTLTGHKARSQCGADMMFPQ